MELRNSLGCKLCRRPLEPCERVNKTSVCKRLGCNCTRDTQPDKSLLKHEGTFRQQLLQGGRAEELDPQAVAARCGHMFHRGCLKKLTTELNTSCIDCPVCLKPIVLAHLWPIEFHCPESESSRHPKTLPAKVRSMNEKNNSLQDELTALRRLRQHKEIEQKELIEAIKILKQNITTRTQKLDEKLTGLFGTTTIDEQYEESIRFEKEAILERVKALTKRNTELLSTIEERAKQHYINEGENSRGDPCLQSIQCKFKETQELEKHRAELEQVMPARIIQKPAHIPHTKKQELNIEGLLKSVDSQRVGCKSFCDDDKPVQLPRSMEVNLSAIEQQEDEQLYCRLPLANVTRSMQELFEQEKLQYLQTEQNDRNGNQEFFPEHTKVLESGDCGDTCHNSGLSSSVQYVLPSPPECESHEEQCPQHHECKETIKSKVSEGDKDTEAGNDCWNERFKHIRNRAAERQKNAPRLLITKPLKLRLSKTNLLRKKSAKATHSGSPMKSAFALSQAQQQQFQRWCKTLSQGGGDASGTSR